MIIEEIPFFTEFVILGLVLGFGYGFTKLFLNHAKDKNRITRKEKKVETDNKLENELDKYLDNAPAIIHHLESEIANLKEKGSTPEQTQRTQGMGSPRTMFYMSVIRTKSPYSCKTTEHTNNKTQTESKKATKTTDKKR